MKGGKINRKQRIISNNTEITNVCHENLIVTSGVKLIIHGILNGSVEVRENCTFELFGIMDGNLSISNNASVRIHGTLNAETISNNGNLIISGVVQARNLPEKMEILPNAIVNQTRY